MAGVGVIPGLPTPALELPHVDPGSRKQHIRAKVKRCPVQGARVFMTANRRSAFGGTFRKSLARPEP